jgi:hypothetical protein
MEHESCGGTEREASNCTRHARCVCVYVCVFVCVCVCREREREREREASNGGPDMHTAYICATNLNLFATNLNLCATNLKLRRRARGGLAACL